MMMMMTMTMIDDDDNGDHYCYLLDFAFPGYQRWGLWLIEGKGVFISTRGQGSAGHGLVPFKVVITNPSGNKKKAKSIFS